MLKTLILFFLSCSLLTAHAAEWLTDFEKAKATAAESDKPIVLVFEGSDWCAPCMKLEKEVLKTETFEAHAAEHFVLLKADFPKLKKNRLSESQQAHNNALAERYNRQGFFPMVLVLDASGKELRRTGYQKVPPKKFIAILEGKAQ